MNIGAFTFGLGFWLLLTGDVSLQNMIIGLLGALVTSRLPVHRATFRQYAVLTAKVWLALPRAYGQALRIMILPHRDEQIHDEPLPKEAGPWEKFEKIFLITLTPQSVALSAEEGKVKIHTIERRSEK